MPKHQSLAITLLFLFILGASGSDYYVATTGSDQNIGTSPDAPFATIQHAVSQMQAGDTCYIRGGSYRETIQLAGISGKADEPITITSFENETVTIDGTDSITSQWVLDQGSIHKTTTDKNISQLFVDGKLMTLARFPNALAFSDIVWQRTAVRCQRSRETTNTRGVGGRVIDNSNDAKSIAKTGHSFNDCIALMNFGAHATGSRIVENHTEGTSEFAYQPELFKFKTTLGYFFEGGKNDAERRMLDIPQEWAFDESNKTLYLWADNDRSPQGRAIRGKTRTYGFVGDASTQHITIDGLNFFACAFQFTSSDHICIQNCHLNYYACSKRALGILGASDTASFIGSKEDSCSHITVYNCRFRYADASGLVARSVEHMRIENNLFSHIDYACANNDNGVGAPFNPSSTLDMDRVSDLLYRRNTLSVCGNAQSFSANLDDPNAHKRFNPKTYQPDSVRPIVCEYNFHTRCGLLHTDGSSLYIPGGHAKESTIRYNWFINNGQRDFRWDGANRPLSGVNGNLYRNVAVGGQLKKMSPSGGNGFRVKGSYHEVYHNLGINRGGELNIATEKGGNAQTTTVNNAASYFTDHPIPGNHSNNYGDRRKSPRKLKGMLRDVINWDFRPRADAVELIDQGIPVSASIQGNTTDITAGFAGEAPDIGAYEFGAKHYWIPGHQEAVATIPIPRNQAEAVSPKADLMYLIGLNGVATKVYFGQDSENLALIATQPHTENIVTPKLEPGQTYFWRVDTQLKGGSVTQGTVWSFSTITDSNELK